MQNFVVLYFLKLLIDLKLSHIVMDSDSKAHESVFVLRGSLATLISRLIKGRGFIHHTEYTDKNMI